MSGRDNAIEWEVHPPDGEQLPAEWLSELSEMRGRVLYDGGRRPCFRHSNGIFDDRDPRDRFAYHLVARAARRAIGCIRLVPLDAVATGVSEEIVGEELFRQALDVVGVRRWHTAECGRWIVDAEWRRSRVGMHLAAGIIAIGRQLGFRLLVGPTGVRDGQASLLTRIGMRPLPRLARVEVSDFDDDLDVLYLFPHQVEPGFGRVIDDMAMALKIDGLCSREAATAYETHASA